MLAESLMSVNRLIDRSDRGGRQQPPTRSAVLVQEMSANRSMDLLACMEQDLCDPGVLTV